MILEWSVRVTLLALGVGAVLTVLRVRSAAVRHLAWTGVMMGMLLMPASLAWAPRIAVPVLSASQPAAIGEPLPLLETTDISATQSSPARLRNEPTATPIDWQTIVISAYLLITCLMLARLLQATLWMRRITSQVVSAPITVGWLHPVMLLPKQSAEWPAGQREAVVLHEQEHIRRRDPLIRWLSLLNRALFWFHPLAWWLERRLSALAEQACDAAVLERGYAPADYARYLIDVARLVEQAGGRVRLHAAFGEANPLSERVRQILRYSPSPVQSRTRSLAIAALGGLVLILSAACTLERRELPAAGQPSMAELRNQRAQKGQEQQAKETAIREEVLRMTPEQARAIEAKLKANPDDPDTYRKMVRYYQRVVDVAGMDALALWYIEHQPDTRVFPGRINPEWDRAGYERGKALWLANLKKPGASAQMYNRAAMYLQAGDLPLAEQVLLDGQKLFPKEVGSELGTVYALALLGAVNGLNQGGSPYALSAQEAHSPFAQSVRAKLAASQDPVRLTMTAQRLMIWGLRPGRVAGKDPLDFDPIELAKSLNDRALSIQPGLSSALRQKVEVDEMATGIRLRNVAPAQMSDSDRMFWLWRDLQYGHAREKAAADARELLALAARLPDDPNAANAVFFGNQALGRVTLKRGETSEAVRHLRASMTAPATDHLRYKEIDMTLARGLVDVGERTAVAEFLEHAAQFNQQQFHPLAKWAAEIREGKNPELTPYFSSY